MTKKLSLTDRLLATGNYVRAANGNGVVRKTTAPQRASNVDDAGFPLHAGNPVWMD